MANKINHEKQALIQEVIYLKKSLSDAGIKKVKILFFDECYGKILKAKSMKLDNLWSGKIADKDFTHKLSKFTNKHV